MLHYDRLGLKPAEWVTKIAEEYGCSAEAVERDWSERKTWLQTFLRIDDVEEVALDILSDHEAALADATELYDEAKDVKMKTQALWLRFKAIQMKVDFLKELGALGKIKSEFNIRNGLYSRDRTEEVYPEEKRKREMLERLSPFA